MSSFVRKDIFIFFLLGRCLNPWGKHVFIQ
jgi:hypothetical protein